MHPKIETIQTILRTSTREMPSIRVPEAGKWSASEILEHLSLTYSRTAQALEDILARGEPLATRPTLKQRVAALMVVECGHFPKGAKAPAIVQPSGVQDALTLEVVMQQLARMDAAITACEERFGSVALIDHPILGPLNARKWRRFHLVHARDHAPQLERLWSARA